MRNRRWSGPLTVVVAVTVVATLSLLTVTVLSSLGDDGSTTLDVDGGEVARPTTTITSTTTSSRPRTTTTSAPEVLGDVIERPAEAAAATTSVPTSAPAPPPPSTPATTAAPPTTTTTCRNSFDPACGPLVWDPQPGPYEVEVYAREVPATAVVGEPVTLAVEYVEPAGGTAVGACAWWTVEDPGVVNTSSCEEVAHACDRHGPHDPPLPSRDRVPVEREVTFTTPGEHTVRVSGHTATHLPDGCANPYLNSIQRTYTVVVSER